MKMQLPPKDFLDDKSKRLEKSLFVYKSLYCAIYTLITALMFYNVNESIDLYQGISWLTMISLPFIIFKDSSVVKNILTVFDAAIIIVHCIKIVSNLTEHNETSTIIILTSICVLRILWYLVINALITLNVISFSSIKVCNMIITIFLGCLYIMFYSVNDSTVLPSTKISLVVLNALSIIQTIKPHILFTQYKLVKCNVYLKSYTARENTSADKSSLSSSSSTTSDEKSTDKEDDTGKEKSE